MKTKNIKVQILIVGIICAVIIAIVVLLQKGSGQISNNSSEATQAKVKLSQRYNKEFVIKKVYSKKIGQSYYEVDAYPQGEEETVFRASIDTKDEYFSDNYVERHICNKISKEIYNNLGGTDNTYIFTETIGPQPITDDIEQSISDYANLSSYSKFRTSIFVTSEISGMYDSSTLFSNLEYIDISAEVYIVNEKQLQEIKECLLNYGSTNDMEYRSLTQNLTSRSI